MKFIIFSQYSCLSSGIAFISGEIGSDVENLDEAAIEIIGLVGYQRLAMQIIGALNSPINKKKTPLSWIEIKSLIVDLRVELGLLPSNIP